MYRVRPVKLARGNTLFAEFHCQSRSFKRFHTRDLFGVINITCRTRFIRLARGWIWRSGSRSLIVISPRISQSVQLNPPKISSVYAEAGPWKVGHKVWQSRVKKRSFELWAWVCWGVLVPGFRKPTNTAASNWSLVVPSLVSEKTRRCWSQVTTYVVQIKRMAMQIKSKRMWAFVKNEKLTLVAAQFQKSIVGFLSVKKTRLLLLEYV